MNDANAPTLLDLDLGFLALSRRLCASAFYRALRPDERSVVVEALLAARYAPGGEFWFAGQRVPLAIGQFIDSEEEIARRAGVSRKCVRTAYRKMAAAGLLVRSRAHPAGQCPFVSTVVGYGRILPGADATGPRADPPTVREGAKNGPADGPPIGHQGAPSEQGNPGTTEHGDPSPSPAAPARRGRGKQGGGGDPRHRPLQERLEAVFREMRGTAYGFQRRDAKAITDLLRLSSGDVAEVERRWRVGLAESGFRRCDTIHDLAAVKWNAYAGTAPRTSSPPSISPPERFTGTAEGFGP